MIREISLRLRPNFKQRVWNPLKDLDISCMLALFLIREARKDVATVKMTSKQGLEFVIRKNDLSQADENARLKDRLLLQDLQKCFSSRKITRIVESFQKHTVTFLSTIASGNLSACPERVPASKDAEGYEKALTFAARRSNPRLITCRA